MVKSEPLPWRPWSNAHQGKMFAAKGKFFPKVAAERGVIFLRRAFDLPPLPRNSIGFPIVFYSSNDPGYYILSIFPSQNFDEVLTKCKT